jgi:hypothetical protein
VASLEARLDNALKFPSPFSGGGWAIRASWQVAALRQSPEKRYNLSSFMADGHILERTPSSEDELQCHKPLAAAIASLIRSATGGKAIALLGGWGTGKSTVVNLLKGDLEAATESDTKNTRVLVFDAWAHQGDPLRRSFLTWIFDQLSREEWVNRSTLEPDFKKTVGLCETVKTTTRKSVSIWGGLIGIYGVLAVAAGSVLPKWDPSKPRETGPFLWINGVIASLAILLPALAWLSNRPHARFWREEFWTKYRDPNTQSFYQLLIKDSGEEKTIETNRTLDPTSTEFRKFFGDVCSACLGVDKNRRLVVVIDNLDRVDPTDALSMWGTMRVFFEFDDGKGNEWADNFWLVVPFDPTALLRLWQGEDESLVAAFVDKTFDVVYRVPPPTLTRRKDFFKRKLSEALPALAPADCDVIYRMVDRFRDQVVSPREIKLFVNRLVTLHLQWKSKGIDCAVLALYVLKAGLRHQQNAEQFDVAVPAGIIDLLPEESRKNWESCLGAVHYNVSIDQAGETIDGPKILRALETNDMRSLNLLQGKDWFWDVCDRLVRDRGEEWEGGPDLLASAILSLDQCQPKEKSRDIAVNVWRKLRAMTLRTPGWGYITERKARAVIAIAARADTPKSEASELRLRLCDLARQPEPTSLATPTVAAEVAATPPKAGPLVEWVRGLMLILEAFEGEPELDGYKITLAGNSAQVLYFTAAWCRQKKHQIPLARFNVQDRGATIQALGAIGFTNAVGDEYLDLLDALKSAPPWPWERFETDLPPWTESASADSVARLTRILLVANPVSLQRPDTNMTRLSSVQALRRWFQGFCCK